MLGFKLGISVKHGAKDARNRLDRFTFPVATSAFDDRPDTPTFSTGIHTRGLSRDIKL